MGVLAFIKMFPVGHFASCAIKDTDSYVLHLCVRERSPQILSVYATNAVVMYTAEIYSEDLQKVIPGGNITTHLECLRQSVASQSVALYEAQNKLVFTLEHNTEVVLLPVRLQVINSVDEKMEHLKSIIIQLANKAQAQPAAAERRGDAGDLGTLPRYEEASLYLPRAKKKHTSRRSARGMSIVNPASRRLKIKPGIRFDDDS
ncbi:uncharacterized protein LOC134539154 isoform X2 [Bacillus rossius redtenbacheri]|uniref:uncharacterized protein LOC134539154 isoform X2 n=1 Tax=Bacillus rossius redtenbacheri TaxID=93214 RepID=UPI002FDE3923